MSPQYLVIIKADILFSVSVRDLNWDDQDLIVERAPVGLYNKGPLKGTLMVLYGLLLGFGGTLFVGVTVLLIIIRTSHGAPTLPSHEQLLPLSSMGM